MTKNDIEQLREKLNTLIFEDSDYSEILKISHELDKCISEFLLTQIGKKSTTPRDEGLSQSDCKLIL